MSPYVIPGLKKFERGGASMTRLIEIGCLFLDVDIEQIKKRSRVREHCAPRQMLMAALTGRCYSLRSIGEFFGGRDHTTVIHSRETVKDLCTTDSEYKRVYEELLAHIETERTKTAVWKVVN